MVAMFEAQIPINQHGRDAALRGFFSFLPELPSCLECQGLRSRTQFYQLCH